MLRKLVIFFLTASILSTTHGMELEQIVPPQHNCAVTIIEPAVCTTLLAIAGSIFYCKYKREKKAFQKIFNAVAVYGATVAAAHGIVITLVLGTKCLIWGT